ncbi:MAG: hypothetical protein H6Q14_1902 [Bacteroidetes bacterium]|nr:hypothetical protein [Bacteroidota bacterium]
MDIYLSTAYLAPVEYYAKLISHERVFIEYSDNYIKQTYRNRCSIVAANGIMPLSIPIEKPQTSKCLTRDIRIAEHGNWRHLHWNSIVSAYNSTPFFEYYEDELHPFYEKKFNFLFDYNEQLRELICSWIGIETGHIRYTSDFKMEFAGNELDFREIIHPKKDWQSLDSNFQAEPYYQVFSAKFGFIPNQSVVDLVFNMGNESILALEKSAKI